MLLQTYLKKSVLNLQPKCHIRFYAPAVRPVRGRPRIQSRQILVLNPKNITTHYQPTTDISGLRHAKFNFIFDDEEIQTVRLYYYHKEKVHFPYPENTHGCLYYCTPSQDRPPISGSFRFRVLPSTSDPPKGFAEGTDLLRPDGRPWELPLYSAIHSPGYSPLVQKLLDERLIDTDLLDSVAELPHSNLRVPSGVLYTLSDPFTLSLGQAKHMTIITKDNSLNFRFRPLIDPPLGQYPFTGTVLVRFEKSNLPEHMHKRVVVVRVLDILSPITCVIPNYTKNVRQPEAGQLIAKRRTPNEDYRPWSIDISAGIKTAAQCLGLLYPESTLPSPLKCWTIGGVPFAWHPSHPELAEGTRISPESPLVLWSAYRMQEG